MRAQSPAPGGPPGIEGPEVEPFAEAGARTAPQDARGLTRNGPPLFESTASTLQRSFFLSTAHFRRRLDETGLFVDVSRILKAYIRGIEDAAHVEQTRSHRRARPRPRTEEVSPKPEHEDWTHCAAPPARRRKRRRASFAEVPERGRGFGSKLLFGFAHSPPFRKTAS